uniref:Uncharacterized protein n=1 Tax=uncultured marine virus TaxID=186617 RepID=A0A0F7L807_9VIRU|nr:hypothetical protein [uncultured marine virus]
MGAPPGHRGRAASGNACGHRAGPWQQAGSATGHPGSRAGARSALQGVGLRRVHGRRSQRVRARRGGGAGHAGPSRNGAGGRGQVDW